MFTFKPAIYRQSTLHELPRPITALRIQDAWDYEQFKLLLVDGDVTAGHSRSGVDITIEGQFGSHEGTPTLTEQQMFDQLEALRSALDVTSDDDKYELFLYHDQPTATYRKLTTCTTARFDYDLTNPHLFTWSTLIHAESPTIQITPPGT